MISVDPSGRISCGAPPFQLPPIEVPFPDFLFRPPIQLDPDPYGGSPQDKDLISCVPCNWFTVAKWGEDLCNYGARCSCNSASGRKPRPQSCPCSSMKDAKNPLTEAEIRKMFNGVLQKFKLPNKCQVDLVVQKNCGARNFLVTCGNKQNHLGPHKICIPTSIAPSKTGKWTPRCNLAALIGHELVHVLQFCEQRSAGQKTKTREKITCRTVEAEAYAYNCALDVVKACVPPKPENKRQTWIKGCIARGKAASCNIRNRRGFTKLCNRLFQSK